MRPREVQGSSNPIPPVCYKRDESSLTVRSYSMIVCRLITN